MDERDKGLYDRSRYGSGSRSTRSSSQSREQSASTSDAGRYHDSFYDDMRLPDEEDVTLSSYVSRYGESSNRYSRAARQTDDESAASGENVTSRASRASRSSYSRYSSTGDAAESANDGGERGYSSYAAGAGRSQAASKRPARRSYSRTAVEQDIATGASGVSAGSTAVAKKRSPNTRLKIAIVALVAVVLIGTGAAIAFVNGVSSNLRSGINQELLDVLVETDMANEPFYMLLLGTDGSAERDEDGELGGVYRSDSMMLARIDVPNHKVTIVSIPRDILVDLGQYGQEKINAAYAYGGAPLAIKAVSSLAGVPISHYAQVDFDGFCGIVDALGGVEVEVPITFYDEDAGGGLDAGWQTLNGSQALILSRSRHAFEEFGGDEMRSANQRMVISAIAKKALASDIGTIARTVQAASEFVTTDLALNDIIGLAQAMRGLDPENDIYTGQVPTMSQYVNGGWYEYLLSSEWQTMMKRIDDGLPPEESSEIDPRTGVALATSGDGATAATGPKYCTVTVKNATSTSGLASSVRSKLVDAKFMNVVIGDVDSSFSYPQTLVVYNSASHKNEAQAALETIGQGELYLDEKGEYNMTGTDVLVIIGANWK